MNADTGE